MLHAKLTLMKKYFTIFLLSTALVPQMNNAQSYSKYKGDEPRYVSATEWEYDVYTSDFNPARKRFELWLNQKSYTIIKQDETKFTHTFHFSIPKADAKMVDSVISSMGYISSKELHSYNQDKQKTEAQLQLEYLEKKKAEYEKMQVKIDSVKSAKYYEHWEKTREIDAEIYEAKRRIKMIEAVDDLYTIKVVIRDETTSPSYTRVNFVHMPGVEYTYLMIEQPKQGLSHEVYQGINLKYLFTRGKSFFEMGAYKAAKDSIRADSVAYQELFMFEFGQDFYSRHFGRGSRKFFNLYIGYKTGLAIGSTDTRTTWIPTISPNIGVELFKNKYICLDTRANYFLPLVDNRHLRGWAFSGAFNFVF